MSQTQKALELLRYFSPAAHDLPEDEATLSNVLKQLLALGVGPGDVLVNRYLNKGTVILALLNMGYYEVLRIFQRDFQIDLSKVPGAFYVESSLKRSLKNKDRQASMNFLDFYLESSSTLKIENEPVREAYHNWKKEKFFHFCLLQNADRKPEGVPDIPDDVFYVIARHLAMLECS